MDDLDRNDDASRRICAAKTDCLPLNEIIGDLFAQLRFYGTLSQGSRQDFIFYVPRDKAMAASKENFRISCWSEHLLEQCGMDAISPNLKTGRSVERVYVTKGRCDKTDGWVMRRLHIGHDRDVNPADYAKVRSSPDQSLADAFPPICSFCSHEQEPFQDVTHDTLVSFTRYLPADLIEVFDAVDRSEGKELRLRADNARFFNRSVGHVGWHQTRNFNRLIAAAKSERKDAQGSLERALRSFPSDLLFWTTRVKGSGRLADKILRGLLFRAMGDDQSYAASLQRPIAGVDQYTVDDLVHTLAEGSYAINDRAGLRAVTKTRRHAARLAYQMSAGLMRQYGPDAIVKDVEFIDKPGHTSYKLSVRYGPPGADIVIAMQFMGLEDLFKDQADHPVYEERQRSMVLIAEKLGLPVGPLREAIAEVCDPPHGLRTGS